MDSAQPNPGAFLHASITGVSVMSFWTAAQIQRQRDKLALHFLALNGYATYAPRLKDRRTVRNRKVVKSPLLFPGYCFIQIELQWSTARYCPGVARLVLDGDGLPAVVPDTIITSLKAREGIDGLIELPPPPPRFRRGDHVFVRRGPFANKVGLYAGMRPHERIAVLLKLLGGLRRVELADADVARWP